MKQCSKCNELLSPESFSPNKRKKDGLNPSCKICESAQDKIRRSERTRIIAEIKSENPCIDCGNFYHPVAMQFDHVRGEKKYNIGYMASIDISWERILEEISKCDIVCSNCHAVRTWVTTG